MVKCPICERELRSNGLPLHLKAHERKGETINDSENKDNPESNAKESNVFEDFPTGVQNDDREQIDLDTSNDNEGELEMDSRTNNTPASAGDNAETHNIRIIEGTPEPKIPPIVQSGMDKFLDKHGDEIMGIAAAVIGTAIQGLTQKQNQTPAQQEGMVKDILGNPVQDF